MDTDLFVECLKENMCCLEVFSVHKDRDNNTSIILVWYYTVTIQY